MILTFEEIKANARRNLATPKKEVFTPYKEPKNYEVEIAITGFIVAGVLIALSIIL
jgi:hypothetical protein